MHPDSNREDSLPQGFRFVIRFAHSSPLFIFGSFSVPILQQVARMSRSANR